jgi:hypothetical protein
VLACGARALAARKGVWGDGKSVCRTQGQKRELGPITCWMEAVTKCARVWKRAQNGAKYAGAEQCCFWHYSGICGVVPEVVVSRVARGITAGLRCTEMHGVCVDQLRIKWGSIIEGCLGVLAKLGSCMTKMCPRQQRLPRGSWGDVLRVCRLDMWLSHILTVSYGCEVWAPQFLRGGGENASERLLRSFLRHAMGRLPQSTPAPVVLAEAGFYPLATHWGKLVTRFWNRLVGLPDTRVTKWALFEQLDLLRAHGGAGGVARQPWGTQVVGYLRSLGLGPLDGGEPCQVDVGEACTLADEAHVEGVLQGAPSQPKVQFYCASVRGGLTRDTYCRRPQSYLTRDPGNRQTGAGSGTTGQGKELKDPRRGWSNPPRKRRKGNQAKTKNKKGGPYWDREKGGVQEGAG